MAEEQPRLDEWVRRLNGEVLVWSGPIPDAAQGVKRCMVRSRLYLARDLAGKSHPPSVGMTSLVGHLAALPLKNQGVDGLVLHHSLEGEEDPRSALREVGRVIAPGGRLIICAFNVFSAWGLRSFYGRFRDDVFSGLKFINPLRLFDWLALLGFELDGRPEYLGYGAPLNIGRDAAGGVASWLGKTQPPVAGALLIAAVKQAQGIHFNPPTRLLRRGKLATSAYPRLRPQNKRVA